MIMSVRLPLGDPEWQNKKSGIAGNTEPLLKACELKRDKDEVILHKNVFGGQRKVEKE